jgi:ATP-binding protein involved in chromosome partitioning
MASNLVSQLIGQCKWEELDYLVIDFPPGTGDIQLTLG